MLEVAQGLFDACEKVPVVRWRIEEVGISASAIDRKLDGSPRRELGIYVHMSDVRMLDR